MNRENVPEWLAKLDALLAALAQQDAFQAAHKVADAVLGVVQMPEQSAGLAGDTTQLNMTDNEQHRSAGVIAVLWAPVLEPALRRFDAYSPQHILEAASDVHPNRVLFGDITAASYLEAAREAGMR